MKYDVVIIGGGLGGLECGCLLAKRGLNVCLIEKNARVGGALQSFQRKGYLFDTGFHYVGGMLPGQPLHQIFNQLNLLHLPWHQLDTQHFDEVILNGEHYRFVNGYDPFADTLINDFSQNGHPLSPADCQGLRDYAHLLKQIGDSTFERLSGNSVEQLSTASYFSQSAYRFLKERIQDERLVGILGGTSLKMELKEETLPLYTFAQINSSFIQSAWRLRDGGEQIVQAMAKNITDMGGTILTPCSVTKLIETEGVVKAAELDNGEIIEGSHFISNIHPAQTLALVPDENSVIKNIFRKRITRLENTFGMFTVNIALKPERVHYLNRNLFIHNKIESIWNKNEERESPEVRSLMVSYQVPKKESRYTNNIDILMPMYWNEVEKWTDTRLFHRGEEYEEFKMRMAECCIRRVCEHIPDLKDNIEAVYTSTPLTYRDYTGTVNGSAYGIRKDYAKAMLTVLSPSTPLPNLFFTGQNLNLHGVLGVSMTALMTSRMIVK